MNGALAELGGFALMLRAVSRQSALVAGEWAAWVRAALTGRPRPAVMEARETIGQMSSAGAASLPVTLITALFTGMVLALQTGITLERKMSGISSYLGGMVALSMLRELGPVLTALIVTGRVGSAMAAELGTMRVTEQIDALVTLMTNPVRYLVVPRVVALVLMMPVLAIFSDAVGVAGGYLVAHVRFEQSWNTYAANALGMVRLGDLISGLVKSVFFGWLVATVSCFKGFTTSGGAEGVGRSTTSAVVIASMAILISDYVLTAAMSVL